MQESNANFDTARKEYLNKINDIEKNVRESFKIYHLFKYLCIYISLHHLNVYALSQIEKRIEEYSSISSKIEGSLLRGDAHFVPTNWLKHWITGKPPSSSPTSDSDKAIMLGSESSEDIQILDPQTEIKEGWMGRATGPASTIDLTGDETDRDGKGRVEMDQTQHSDKLHHAAVLGENSSVASITSTLEQEDEDMYLSPHHAGDGDSFDLRHADTLPIPISKNVNEEEIKHPEVVTEIQTSFPQIKDTYNPIFCEPISNMANMCSHKSGLHPTMLQNYKVISHDAFSVIISSISERYQGESNVKLIDYDITRENVICHKCIYDVKKKAESTKASYDKYLKMYELCDAKLNLETKQSRGNQSPRSLRNGNSSTVHRDNIGYYVEKSWLSSLKKLIDRTQKLLSSKPSILQLASGNTGRKRNHSSFAATAVSSMENFVVSSRASNVDSMTSNFNASQEFTDVIPNTTLSCKHNQFSPEHKRRAKLVSAKAWNNIRKHYPNAIEYSTSSEVCPVCAVDMEEANESKKDERTKRQIEISEKCLQTLYNRKAFYPSEIADDCDDYFLSEKR